MRLFIVNRSGNEPGTVKTKAQKAAEKKEKEKKKREQNKVQIICLLSDQSIN